MFCKCYPWFLSPDLKCKIRYHICVAGLVFFINCYWCLLLALSQLYCSRFRHSFEMSEFKCWTSFNSVSICQSTEKIWNSCFMVHVCKCLDLLFFSVWYCKLNVFSVWTVSWTKQDAWQSSRALWTCDGYFSLWWRFLDWMMNWFILKNNQQIN